MKPIDHADFGRTVADYIAYRAGFPDSLHDRLARMGIDYADRDVLDVGTGTGTLAHAMAARGGRVTAVDPSEEMLAGARSLMRTDAPVTFRIGTGEATGCGDASMDVVTCGQCWHWFDRPAACAELARVLRPDGHLLILYFDWLPLPDNLVARTEALIEAFNPAWKGGGGVGMHPQVLTDLATAGWRSIESFGYDAPVRYSHEGWRGRIRASAGVAATKAPAEVAEFDAALAALMAKDFPDDPLDVAHRVFAVVARPPSA